MIALMIIAYLLVGFIQSSLLHKYFWDIPEGLSFVMLTIGWPITTFAFGLGMIGQCLNGYLKWLKGNKE